MTRQLNKTSRRHPLALNCRPSEVAARDDICDGGALIPWDRSQHNGHFQWIISAPAIVNLARATDSTQARRRQHNKVSCRVLVRAVDGELRARVQGQ